MVRKYCIKIPAIKNFFVIKQRKGAAINEL